MRIEYKEDLNIAFEVKKLLDEPDYTTDEDSRSLLLDDSTLESFTILEHNHITLNIQPLWEKKMITINVNDKVVFKMYTNIGLSNFACASIVEKCWNAALIENESK